VRMEEKKVASWRKLFRAPDEEAQRQRRLQELAVLLSELESVKGKGANVFKGLDKTVFFKTSQSAVRAEVRKEQSKLVKQQKEALASQQEAA